MDNEDMPVPRGLLFWVLDWSRRRGRICARSLTMMIFNKKLLWRSH